jgi:GTP:adenosylcobinamide-phosphate guanylyltransferase
MAELNNAVALVSIPLLSVQDDLYILNAALAQVQAAAVATFIFTLDIVIVAQVVFLRNTH